MPVLFLAQVVPAQTAGDKASQGTGKTTSLDYLTQALEKDAEVQVFWYFIEPDKNAKNKAKIFFHRGIRVYGEKTPRFSVKAAEIVIPNPKNNSQISLYVSDQNGDGLYEYVGLAEKFNGQKTAIDLGVVYFETEVKRTDGQKPVTLVKIDYAIDEYDVAIIKGQVKVKVKSQLNNDQVVHNLVRTMRNFFSQRARPAKPY